MLVKCMKYHTKAFARIMLPLITVFGFTWAILALYLNYAVSHTGFLYVLMLVLMIPFFFFSIFGIPTFACLYAAKRYDDVMFSDKAFLMRMLPVTGRAHFICIFLNSVFWYFVSMGVLALSLLLPLFSSEDGFFRGIYSVFQKLIEDRSEWLPMFFSGFATLLFFELTIILAGTLAARHNGSRVLIGFAYFIALQFVFSFVQGMVLAVVKGANENDAGTGYFDISTTVSRIVICVGIFVFISWYADKKADVR